MMLRRCCCLTLLVVVAGSVALILLASSSIGHRQRVRDACGNARHASIRVLDGFPFTCGWQQLRPPGFGGADYVPQAFIQPNGSWCWSNAGYVSSGLLIDTLTDPVLTREMLSGIKGDIKALVFTHPDVDHILGDQVVPDRVPRLGTRESEKEVVATLQSGLLSKLKLSLALGHFVWSAAQLIGWRELVTRCPTGLQATALKVLGWARAQTFLSHFNFEEVDVQRPIKFSTHLESGSFFSAGHVQLPGSFRHFGPIHSKSDSVVLLPDSKVAYTGDLLFIGIAPVMWAGPAMAWIAALDTLLAETGQGWLFVPGHGPVTDAEGVRTVRRYFEYVDSAVTEVCSDLPLKDATLDEACAERVLASFPSELASAFQEPQRVMICAAIERMARRERGPAKVQLATKIKYMAKMGEFEVRQALSAHLATSTAAVGGAAVPLPTSSEL